MSESLIVQRPAGPAPQLILLFHGVGSAPAAMLPLARRMAAEWPTAFVVCVQAPLPGDGGQGWQWFSVQGIDEANRPARVAEAMPGFLATVEHWQRESGAPPEVTALVGFSQGAIMALEATAQPRLIAGRVVALSGRYATTPHLPPPHTTLHFVHGKTDPVIHYGFTVSAAETLVAAGADLTADVLPNLGHAIDDRVAELLIERLRTHLPAHRWQEAMQAARDLGEEGHG
jgi:phospholipase/carboxylesterase